MATPNWSGLPVEVVDQILARAIQPSNPASVDILCVSNAFFNLGKKHFFEEINISSWDAFEKFFGCEWEDVESQSDEEDEEERCYEEELEERMHESSLVLLERPSVKRGRELVTKLTIRDLDCDQLSQQFYSHILIAPGFRLLRYLPALQHVRIDHPIDSTRRGYTYQLLVSMFDNFIPKSLFLNLDCGAHEMDFSKDEALMRHVDSVQFGRVDAACCWLTSIEEEDGLCDDELEKNAARVKCLKLRNIIIGCVKVQFDLGEAQDSKRLRLIHQMCPSLEKITFNHIDFSYASEGKAEQEVERNVVLEKLWSFSPGLRGILHCSG